MTKQTFNTAYFGVGALAFLCAALVHFYSLFPCLGFAAGFAFCSLLSILSILQKKGEDTLVRPQSVSGFGALILRILAILAPLPVLVYCSLYLMPIWLPAPVCVRAPLAETLLMAESTMFGDRAFQEYYSFLTQWWYKQARFSEARKDYQNVIDCLSVRMIVEDRFGEKYTDQELVALASMFDRVGDYKHADKYYSMFEKRVVERKIGRSNSHYTLSNTLGCGRSVVSSYRLLRLLEQIPNKSTRDSLPYSKRVLALNDKSPFSNFSNYEILDLRGRNKVSVPKIETLFVAGSYKGRHDYKYRHFNPYTGLLSRHNPKGDYTYGISIGSYYYTPAEVLTNMGKLNFRSSSYDYLPNGSQISNMTLEDPKTKQLHFITETVGQTFVTQLTVPDAFFDSLIKKIGKNKASRFSSAREYMDKKILANQFPSVDLNGASAFPSNPRQLYDERSIKVSPDEYYQMQSIQNFEIPSTMKDHGPIQDPIPFNGPQPILQGATTGTIGPTGDYYVVPVDGPLPPTPAFTNGRYQNM